MKKTTRRCPRVHRHLFGIFPAFRVLLILALTLPWSPRPALAEEPLDRQITIDISANTPLEDALIEWGTKAGMTVMINTRTVAPYVTKHVSGTLSARRALMLLLQDSHLSFTQDGQRIHIVPTSSLTRADFQDMRPASVYSDGESEASESNKARSNVDEVIVTAQKREERLQDVPVPVTALSAETLLDTNQLRVQDFSSSVPGLNITPQSSASYATLSIRGVTTGAATNPTVSVMIDDAPFGSSTSLGGGGGSVIPDVDPNDLARVEVLRGPQGTLYGASSLGGLLKFVTVDPSTDQFSGRAQALLTDVYNGAEVGYGVRGSANIPLTDSLAIRASAFTREDPGYIDNVNTDQRGVNEQRVSGGRLAGLWRPGADVSLKISALYQDYRGDGFNDADVISGLGDLQQSYVRGTGGYDRRVQAYSATLDAMLGAAELTSVTSYNINQFEDTSDLTYIFNPPPVAHYTGVGYPAPENNKTDKFSQEARLSFPIGNAFSVLVGAFFTHESSVYNQLLFTQDLSTGAIIDGDAYHINFPVTYSEYAAFADLTYHVTNSFDVQVGARASHLKQSFAQTEYLGPELGGPSTSITPQADSSANAFTYLFTPEYKLSADMMLYARLASGYRAGGPNVYAGPVSPPQYNPDKTLNYELGLKADFFDQMLTVDGSLYYIDWRDIQVLVVPTGDILGVTINGGRAKSQGVELSVGVRPTRGLSIDGWVSWDDAELTQDFPLASGVVANSGDRLPYSSRISGNLSAQQAFPLGGRLTGFVGASLSYVGARMDIFPSVGETRNTFPAYAEANLRSGLDFDAWKFSLFLNNLADRRGVLNGSQTDGLTQIQYIQPRTVGLSATRLF